MGASNRIYGQIAARMGGKPTEELIEIWQDNDRGLWSDQAFRAIKEILINRGIELPVQGRIKRSEPAPRPLIGDFLPNYISWAIYFLFLVWIAVLHPFFYIGSYFTLRIHNPLHPDLLLTFMEVPMHGDGRGYITMWQGLTILELGILCLGIYVGYLLTEKKAQALSWAKTYLIYLSLWILLAFFLSNFYYLLEDIARIKGSVIDIPLDWHTFISDKISKRKMELVGRHIQNYMIPLIFIAIWYIFFAKSRWIVKRYTKN